jgi:hypothetical protein
MTSAWSTIRPAAAGAFTILELADARPCRQRRRCRTMDGRSLVPLLRGEDVGWAQDRAILVEYRGGFEDSVSCSFRGVRTAEQVYVEHTMVPNPVTSQCEPRVEIEHYDLEADRFQLDNLYPADPMTGAAEREAELAGRLATLATCTGIAGRDRRRGTRPFCE